MVRHEHKDGYTVIRRTPREGELFDLDRLGQFLHAIDGELTLSTTDHDGVVVYLATIETGRDAASATGVTPALAVSGAMVTYQEAYCTNCKLSGR